MRREKPKRLLFAFKITVDFKHSIELSFCFVVCIWPRYLVFHFGCVLFYGCPFVSPRFGVYSFLKLAKYLVARGRLSLSLRVYIICGACELGNLVQNSRLTIIILITTRQTNKTQRLKVEVKKRRPLMKKSSEWRKKGSEIKRTVQREQQQQHWFKVTTHHTRSLHIADRMI